MDTKRELYELMIELAQVDREAYRALRARAWAMIARNHQHKTPEQIARWKQQAS